LTRRSGLTRFFAVAIISVFAARGRVLRADLPALPVGSGDSLFFNNETADKCGRLFDGATTADGLTPNASGNAQVKDRSPKIEVEVRKNQPQFRK
jgi:hypothetical protein